MLRIDFAKLEQAGFQIQRDDKGISFYPTATISEKMLELLRSYAKTPMGQDMIVGNTLDTIARARFMELL